MNGRELLRKIKKLAAVKGMDVYINKNRGKGSHITLFVGKRFAIIPDLKKELKTGTYKAILKQLEIDINELR